jgi:small-conductance mechanosensitive channel
VFTWFIKVRNPNEYFHEIFQTVTAFTIIYFLFGIVLEEVISKRIESRKMRFSIRNAFTLLSFLIILIVILGIWGRYPFLSLSLVVAAIAIALQDLFKNFVGGIVIYIAGIYRVGDRIDVHEKCGDVLEIGILYTTLMELKEWINGDQETGRITSIPNSYVLSDSVNNYTKAHPYIWDEVIISVTSNSDWKKAMKRIRSIIENMTKDLIESAEKEVAKLGEKYYVRKQIMRPSVFSTLEKDCINFTVRYITKVRERRELNNMIKQTIFTDLKRSRGITLIST